MLLSTGPEPQEIPNSPSSPQPVPGPDILPPQSPTPDSIPPEFPSPRPVELPPDGTPEGPAPIRADGPVGMTCAAHGTFCPRPR